MIELVSQLAAGQHGVFAAHQARSLGIHPSRLTRACARHRIIRVAPGVYAIAGAPDSRRRQLMAAVLTAGPDALATGDSALGLWCEELRLPVRPEVSIPRTCGHRSQNARVRRSGDHHLARATILDGIPVVGVARALLDAAIGRSPDEVLRRIDACRRQRPVAVGALVEAHELHARRGRPGTRTFLRALVELAQEVPDSDFERWVVRDLVAAGVDRPRLHVVARVEGCGAIEMDLSWPGVPLDVELDGGDHTTRARTGRRDRARDRALASIGVHVLRYTWADWVQRRAETIAEIDAAVARSRAESLRCAEGISPRSAEAVRGDDLHSGGDGGGR